MQAPTLEPLAHLCAALALMTLLHPVLQRAWRRAAPQRVAMVTCVAGLGAPLALGAAHEPSVLAYDVLVCACASYAYFHLFNMSETARRVRILLEVSYRGGVEESELRRMYSDAEVVDKRLKRMIDMGAIELRSGRYVVTGRLLYFAARVLDAWRRVLGYARTAP
jgi:hypothetical protein